MITRAELQVARARAAEMIRKAGVVAKDEEFAGIQAADFGLSRLATEGAQILTFFATDRISAKAIALFPHQTLPEHWHPPVGDDPGKEEIIRVAGGTVYFYTPGSDTLKAGKIPDGKAAVYTCRHETVMRPGDQIVLEPGLKHWLQAGPDGAVVYSFSTCVRDILDGFTDPDIVRETVVVD